MRRVDERNSLQAISPSPWVLLSYFSAQVNVCRRLLTGPSRRDELKCRERLVKKRWVGSYEIV